MELELRIVDLLARRREEFTINGIAEELGEHYSLVHRKIEELDEKDVINRRKVGKAHICSLNLESERTRVLLQLSEIEKRDDLYSRKRRLKIILEDLLNLLKSSMDIRSVVLFGSYAKGAETSESDIDVLIVSQNRGGIDRTTRKINSQYNVELNPVVLSPEGVKDQEEKALISEVVKDHIVIYGVSDFVELFYR